MTIDAAITTTAFENQGAPFQPTEQWIDAFTQQCTHKLRLDMKQYARWRGRGVRRMGGHVDETYAEDMVASVLTDTLAGVVAWNPSGKTLYQHVEDTIRSRTRHDRLRAKRYKHDRLEAPATLEEKAATRSLVEASLVLDHTNISAEEAIHARQMMERLRSLACGDQQVLAYLDAIVSGARTAAEIIEETRMSKKMFRNARDRLARLVERLESESFEQGVRA